MIVGNEHVIVLLITKPLLKSGLREYYQVRDQRWTRGRVESDDQERLHHIIARGMGEYAICSD